MHTSGCMALYQSSIRSDPAVRGRYMAISSEVCDVLEWFGVFYVLEIFGVFHVFGVIWSV